MCCSACHVYARGSVPYQKVGDPRGVNVFLLPGKGVEGEGADDVIRGFVQHLLQAGRSQAKYM